MIYLGADHGGYELKEKIKKWLKENGFSFEDLGTYSTDSVDYTDFALKVAEKVAKGATEDRGIIVCSTGIGVAIAANKVKGIRAAVGYNLEAARRTREDNDSNVLTLGGLTMDHQEALKIVEVWLKTPFSGLERHQRRVKKITDYEKNSQ